MRKLSDIVTVSLGAAALVTLVYAKDHATPNSRRSYRDRTYRHQASGIRHIPTLGWFAPRLDALHSGIEPLRHILSACSG